MGHNLTDHQDKLQALTDILELRGSSGPNEIFLHPSNPSEIYLHPAFQEIYARYQSHLLIGDGPLPLSHRHYIAIMACSRNSCARLAETEKAAFLSEGGDATWLEGLHKAPLKLRRLAEVNKILAHRPWALNQSHIKDLTGGEGSWSLAELVQGIVILIHFHSGSSFVQGCDTTHRAVGQSTRLALQAVIKPGGRIAGGPKTRAAFKTESKSSLVMSRDKTDATSEPNLRSKAKYFRIGKGRSVSESKACQTQGDLLSELEQVYSVKTTDEGINNSLKKFVTDPDYQYVNLSTLPNHEALQLKIHELSWDDHGFSVMSRFYTDMSILLDDKFRVAKSMTHNYHKNKTGVDTSNLRRCIWNYVQCLFGVDHDDFDYGDIDRELSAPLKEFVRLSATSPGSLENTDLQNYVLELKNSEKVHVQILIMEAKMQALLLFSLRAIMDHMS